MSRQNKGADLTQKWFCTGQLTECLSRTVDFGWCLLLKSLRKPPQLSSQIHSLNLAKKLSSKLLTVFRPMPISQLTQCAKLPARLEQDLSRDRFSRGDHGLDMDRGHHTGCQQNRDPYMIIIIWASS